MLYLKAWSIMNRAEGKKLFIRFTSEEKRVLVTEAMESNCAGFRPTGFLKCLQAGQNLASGLIQCGPRKNIGSRKNDMHGGNNDMK